MYFDEHLTFAPARVVFFGFVKIQKLTGSLLISSPTGIIDRNGNTKNENVSYENVSLGCNHPLQGFRKRHVRYHRLVSAISLINYSFVQLETSKMAKEQAKIVTGGLSLVWNK